MKKVLCLLVVWLIAGSISLAESIDLSSMSDDELTTLMAQVDSEITNRGIGYTPISEGVYVVGVSLEQGGYTFTAQRDESGNDYVWVYLGVFNDEKDVWDKDKAVTKISLTESGQSYHLDIKEGQTLHITVPGGTCVYSKE